jgi:hypothetical protein
MKFAKSFEALHEQFSFRLCDRVSPAQLTQCLLVRQTAQQVGRRFSRALSHFQDRVRDVFSPPASEARA